MFDRRHNAKLHPERVDAFDSCISESRDRCWHAGKVSCMYKDPMPWYEGVGTSTADGEYDDWTTGSPRDENKTSGAIPKPPNPSFACVIVLKTEGIEEWNVSS